MIKIRKRVQLSADPWGSPSSRVLLEDVAPSTVVWMVLLVRENLNPLEHLPVISYVTHLHQ